MTLSDRLQALRKEKNLSQEQLAEKLGVSRQAISKWESSQATPDINNILKLSEIYNVSTDYILLGKTMVSQTVSAGSIIDTEKKKFKKLPDMPAFLKVLFVMLLTAIGVFVIIPIFFVIAVEILGTVY